MRLGISPRTRVVKGGSTFTVPPTAIHRVLHAGNGMAVTIHAYSPPLTRTGAYHVGPDGELERISQTYEEEPAAPKPRWSELSAAVQAARCASSLAPTRIAQLAQARARLLELEPHMRGSLVDAPPAGLGVDDGQAPAVEIVERSLAESCSNPPPSSITSTSTRSSVRWARRRIRPSPCRTWQHAPGRRLHPTGAPVPALIVVSRRSLARHPWVTDGTSPENGSVTLGFGSAISAVSVRNSTSENSNDATTIPSDSSSVLPQRVDEAQPDGLVHRRVLSGREVAQSRGRRWRPREQALERPRGRGGEVQAAIAGRLQRLIELGCLEHRARERHAERRSQATQRGQDGCPSLPLRLVAQTVHTARRPTAWPPSS